MHQLSVRSVIKRFGDVTVLEDFDLDVAKGEFIALLGPSGEAEMRLTRLSPGDLRRDPAALDSAMRAQGFFPGMRVVFIDAVPDTLAATIGAVLQAWRPEDARLVVTAGNL